MGVGLQLKAILREQKMTIKQLAEKTDISINTLYSITKRDSSSIDPIILKKIAAALNVPFWKILGGTETNDGKISFSIHLDSDTAASLGVDKLNHGEQLSTTIDFKSPAGSALLKSLGIETSNSTQYKEVLFSAFDRLNEDGQKKAIERVEELTEIQKYQARKEELSHIFVDLPGNSETHDHFISSLAKIPDEGLPLIANYIETIAKDPKAYMERSMDERQSDAMKLAEQIVLLIAKSNQE